MYYNNRKYKRQRLADFNKRKKYAQEKVFTFLIKNQIQEYITVHPMSNEEILLKKLGLKIEDCDKVDCYWNCGKDIIFLEVHCYKMDWLKSPGLYARWSNDSLPMLYLMAILNSSHISQDLLEKVMANSYKLLIERNLLNNGNIGLQRSLVGFLGY